MKLKEGTVRLSEHVRKFLKDKTEKDEEKIADLSQVKPVEITEIKKLMPCVADPSMSRIIANMTPPLGGVLKIIEPLFPRSRYLDRTHSLIIEKEEVIITVYGSGKVSVGMIKNESESREVLEELRNTLNKAIKRGAVPIPKEKVRTKLMEIYKYLPQTNCGKCKEQDCYSFAVKLMAGEATLERCKLLKEPKYASNKEHLQVLTAYI
ncbi:MAG TPA: (Fe-S)-binding protein [Methanosarcina sp.]